MPDSVAVCGLPGALSVICKVAVKVPLPFGLKVTFAVQLAPGVTVPVQVPRATENCPGLAPPMLTPLMFSGPIPVLDTVMGSGLVLRRGMVPKLSAVGFRTATGCTPVPVRTTIWGLVTSESVIVNVPVRMLVVVGAKLTLIRQLRPAPSVVPQLVVSMKFADVAIPLIVSVVVPTFEIVTACDALVVPTSCGGTAETKEGSGRKGVV